MAKRLMLPNGDVDVALETGELTPLVSDARNCWADDMAGWMSVWVDVVERKRRSAVLRMQIGGASDLRRRAHLAHLALCSGTAPSPRPKREARRRFCGLLRGCGGGGARPERRRCTCPPEPPR
jgi:hypothetical protein